jgi:TonB family protein
MAHLEEFAAKHAGLRVRRAPRAFHISDKMCYDARTYVSLGGLQPMHKKSRCVLLVLSWVLVNVFCAYAQPRPPVPLPPAPTTAQIDIQTSPDAEVYLDGQHIGRANSEGRMVIDPAQPGDHALRVSLAGKREYEEKVTVVAGQVTSITAVLEEADPPTGTGAEDSNRNFSIELPTILSDTRGVDFGPYVRHLVEVVRANWWAVIPESARQGEKGRVSVNFEIVKDGSAPQLRLVASSGSDPLDHAALDGIRASLPFPPLPQDFTGHHLVIQLVFLYNLPPH